MNPKIADRIKYVWNQFSNEVESDDETIAIEGLIAHGKERGKEYQISLKINFDEADFLDTGHGEVDLNALMRDVLKEIRAKKATPYAIKLKKELAAKDEKIAELEAYIQELKERDE